MEYDYRKGSGGARGAVPPYERVPAYGRAPATYDRSGGSYGHVPHPSFYPTVGQPSSGPPPVPRATVSSSTSGGGIRVTIKPEYRITPPPQLSPQVGDVPRSTFQFDFDFERKFLADLERNNHNWSRLLSEVSLAKNNDSSSSVSAEDQLINKYVSMGLNREAVSLALANFGDNPTKIRDFATSYSLLREMGFPSHAIAGVLAMYDNDTDKALAHFLNNSS